MTQQADTEDVQVYIQMDHKSGSMRFIARAMSDGRRLPHDDIGKYGGPPDQSIDKICDELFERTVGWLKDHGYNTPEHYWKQRFPHR